MIRDTPQLTLGRLIDRLETWTAAQDPKEMDESGPWNRSLHIAFGAEQLIAREIGHDDDKYKYGIYPGGEFSYRGYYIAYRCRCRACGAEGVFNGAADLRDFERFHDHCNYDLVITCETEPVDPSGIDTEREG